MRENPSAINAIGRILPVQATKLTRLSGRPNTRNCWFQIRPVLYFLHNRLSLPLSNLVNPLRPGKIQKARIPWTPLLLSSRLKEIRMGTPPCLIYHRRAEDPLRRVHPARQVSDATQSPPLIVSPRSVNNCTVPRFPNSFCISRQCLSSTTSTTYARSSPRLTARSIRSGQQ